MVGVYGQGIRLRARVQFDEPVGNVRATRWTGRFVRDIARQAQLVLDEKNACMFHVDC